MKLKLKAVALFSLALGTDHYFLLDIDRGIFVDKISYGDFSIPWSRLLTGSVTGVGSSQHSLLSPSPVENTNVTE